MDTLRASPLRLNTADADFESAFARRLSLVGRYLTPRSSSGCRRSWPMQARGYDAAVPGVHPDVSDRVPAPRSRHWKPGRRSCRRPSTVRIARAGRRWRRRPARAQPPRGPEEGQWWC